MKTSRRGLLGLFAVSPLASKAAPAAVAPSVEVVRLAAAKPYYFVAEESLSLDHWNSIYLAPQMRALADRIDREIREALNG